MPGWTPAPDRRHVGPGPGSPKSCSGTMTRLAKPHFDIAHAHAHPTFQVPTTSNMDNFGVIEIASTTTKTTPGWAYVPDTGPTVPAALQPTNRKRAARNQPALTLSDLSAREETRLRKELEALDKESHRDVNIPIPPRPGRGM
jgi:hypothetical protein